MILRNIFLEIFRKLKKIQLVFFSQSTKVTKQINRITTDFVFANRCTCYRTSPKLARGRPRWRRIRLAPCSRRPWASYSRWPRCPRGHCGSACGTPTCSGGTTSWERSRCRWPTSCSTTPRPCGISCMREWVYYSYCLIFDCLHGLLVRVPAF